MVGGDVVVGSLWLVCCRAALFAENGMWQLCRHCRLAGARADAGRTPLLLAALAEPAASCSRAHFEFNGDGDMNCRCCPPQANCPAPDAFRRTALTSIFEIIPEKGSTVEQCAAIVPTRPPGRSRFAPTPAPPGIAAAVSSVGWSACSPPMVPGTWTEKEEERETPNSTVCLRFVS